MIIKIKRKTIPEGQPLLYADHPKPVTRRDFLGAGLISGGAAVLTPSILGMLASSNANAEVCDLNSAAVLGNGKIPFICFDLGGGANMTGSHVLVGGPGGQEDFLSTAGYNKLGLPDGMLPNVADIVNGTPDHVNRDFGLAMHNDSAFLRGMLSKTSAAARQGCNGAVIPNRSDNDTANNPHNPMYLIAKAGLAQSGAKGQLLTLIGNSNSDSGGRSLAPDFLMDADIRPTKISSASDSRGLVDTGGIPGKLNISGNEVGEIMAAIQRISERKILLPSDQILEQTLRDKINCGYVKTATLLRDFSDPSAFNPNSDIQIVGGVDPIVPARTAITSAIPALTGAESIFTASQFNSHARTASVMKLVINGMAGAGTIQMGGYDYHNGTRATGENRDYNAGQAMGACIEYAHRQGKPLMLYVFTDGSLASNGNLDNSVDGRGKGEWSGDNSSTSASYFIVYNPNGKPVLKTDGLGAERHQQLGYMRSSGSVETNGTTPGANNVNLLAQMVALNYMALHGEVGAFDASMVDNITGSKHGLGDATNFDSLVAFEQIVNGKVGA